MEAAAPIQFVSKETNFFIDQVEFIEESILKKENDEYKIHFGKKENDLIIKVVSENSKNVLYYEEIFPISQLEKISKLFSMYKDVMEIIIFLKKLKFDIEEKNNELIIKFNLFLPDGGNQIIDLNLKERFLDTNHIIKYLLEEKKSLQINIKNLENKHDIEINNLNKNISNNNSEITNLKESIKFNKNEISNLKEENKKLWNALNNNINFYKNEISNLKEENKKLWNALNNNINFYKNEISNLKEENKNLWNALNNNINFYKNEIFNIKEENKKLWEENNKIKILLEKPKINIIETPRIESHNNFIFDSKIISLSNINFILQYIRQNDQSFIFNNLKLLYRGSRDGDSTKTCHQLCDNKKHVLIVIQSDTGHIFGGYSKIGFKLGNREYKIDNNCFLYSYDLRKIYPVVKDKEVICNIEEIRGLCFYGSLAFVDKFMNVYDNKFMSKIKLYFNGLNEDYEMNGGNKHFKCKDLEVFQLI